MDRFLVQVNKNGGFKNIIDNHRYENPDWLDKPRDSDHGEVKRGDELLIYCTQGVPRHGKSIAFAVEITDVSSDRIVFELGEPRWFKSPLSRDAIRELVSEQKLPTVFLKCGFQGFNIVKLDATSEYLLSLLNNGPQGNNNNDTSHESRLAEPDEYTVDNIINEGCFLEKSRLVAILERLRTKKNLILQGPPGTGKTWLAKKLAFALIGRKADSRVRPFQFHPNLSYEDFVRGWRPNKEGRLDLLDGPFLKAVTDSINDPSSNYVMVIEEINRGQPAQIFGEILTLMESDKRVAEEALVLSYSKDASERVYIPPNLHIIGTMNIADRSLALVDLALRRRFAFINLEPTLGDTWRNWVSEQCKIDISFLADVETRLNLLNKHIAEDHSLGPQFRIGHGFVTPSSRIPITDPHEWFRQVVETEIEPLLEEYWFDDPEKARVEGEKLLQGLIP